MPTVLPAGDANRIDLADWLDQNRLSIISQWMVAVRGDGKIPSADHLTISALEDHFPQLLAELIEVLRQADPAVNLWQTQRTGESHGKARWRNGYRLDEVIRELARLREIILGKVRDFAHQRDSPEMREAADEKIRYFFDVVIATSARHFVKEQQAEVVLRTQQLSHAYEQVQAVSQELRLVADSRVRALRGVSHELRNSLHIVNLAADALLNESQSGERMAIATRLGTHAVRLRLLLDRLHEYSDLLAGEAHLTAEPLEVASLIQELVETHGRSAGEKGLKLEGSSTPDLPTIVTDGPKLRKIAEVLVSNAIQYTNSGSVRIKASLDAPGRWILQVADTGMGIDPLNANLIFSEFHIRGPIESRGLGLGLVIARHLAHLLDGEVTFHSALGEGSTFEVNLPLVLTAVLGPDGRPAA